MTAGLLDTDLAAPNSPPAYPRASSAQTVDAAVALTAVDCLTPFGNARATTEALLRGERALRFEPVLGRDGGDLVPLALVNDWQPTEGDEPRWGGPMFELLRRVPDRPWGTERYPIFLVSSNYGIDSMYAHHKHPRDGAHLPFILPQRLTAWFQRRLGWGTNVNHYSHACVSANLGLLYASRQVNAGLAEEALVVSYDFLSPFVTGGFHAMKILLGHEMPAPYADRAFGAIGLGDGAAFAVVAPQGRGNDEFRLEAQAGCNEMYHFTGNHPEGVGMSELGHRMRAATGDRPVWIKGHGTGTIEAGRLEARHMAEIFPASPLVGWKGALGHTLGSCGLVELAVAVESVRQGRAPGTVGTSGACFSEQVAVEAFDLAGFGGVILNAFAFGGAHYACLLCHD